MRLLRLVNPRNLPSLLPGLFPAGIALFCLALSVVIVAPSDRAAGQGAGPPDTARTGGGATPGTEIHFFYSSMCPSCEIVKLQLARLVAVRPEVRVIEHDVVLARNQALHRAFATAAGVPRRMRDYVPAVFIGPRHLVGEEITLENLLEAIDGLALAPGEGQDHVQVQVQVGAEEIEAAELAIEREGGMLSALVIVAAGFADGINPCAFAILVFLVSYLTFAGRSRRQIVATGVAFAAGVFATYLTAGFGLLEATRFLRSVSFLHRAVYLAAAVLCFALAALTIHDLVQVRLGASSAVRLRLPRRLTRFAHTAIKRASASPYLAAAALLTGAVVATTEFVCTGQLYLPTILYMLQTADDVRRPAGMLVLYNVAFVAPMLSAVALVSLGTTSERLAALTKRHAAAIRTAITAVFLCLGIYLGMGFLRMLGLVV
ncbi:MAG: hypothetical protein QME92_08360 [Bacillota bacterium]|nr:hypothetical protein [Bacillota bacterium]